jgi:hypothetical protein
VRINKKIKFEKISKGYRLKASTHKLIDRMQKLMNANQDTIITKACRMLYKELQIQKRDKQIIN